MTRDELRSAIDDRTALVCTIYGEAAGESVHSKVAVACAIRNRVHADLHADGKRDWWGEGFAEVCLKPWQFSCWWETNTNTDRVYVLAQELLVGVRPSKDAAIVDECGWIADGIIADVVRDVTGGATHYVTAKLLVMSPPNWTRTAKRLGTIGSHVYFQTT